MTKTHFYSYDGLRHGYSLGAMVYNIATERCSAVTEAKDLLFRVPADVGAATLEVWVVDHVGNRTSKTVTLARAG